MVRHRIISTKTAPISLQTLERACAIGREEGAEDLAQDFVYLGNPLSFVGMIPLEANEEGSLGFRRVITNFSQ